MQSISKSALVIGGSGSLGKSIVNTFKNSQGWIVYNVDLIQNPQSDKSIILTKQFTNQTIVDLKKSIDRKFDCIINVAGGWKGESLKNEEIVVSAEIMHNKNVATSVLAAHLAKIYLNKNGLLVLTGAASVKDNMSTDMLAYKLAKNSVHYLTDLLVKNPQELPENSKIITLLP
jgi:nucleoside-diphosphate-sugar epimerase